jgi:uncharacterized protein (TIGR00303 family)
MSSHWLRVYSAPRAGEGWLNRYRGATPGFACVLGFTETALISGISAAGATPEARRFTALADAELLYDGPTYRPLFQLPPLNAGASPTVISRAVLAGLGIPIYLFNAGLPQPPSIPHIDLTGQPARCVSTGQALPLPTVQNLFRAGLHWGEKLGRKFAGSYLILAECVVGGTTTAQAVLSGLGFDVLGLVNSSHPNCNHDQKATLVAQGLRQAGIYPHPVTNGHQGIDPLAIVAALGDPMQIATAGLILAASGHSGILLAGGSQMLAVYALTRAIAQYHHYPWWPENIVVGTTPWVIKDSSSDTTGLANKVGEVPLIASQLSFQMSRYPQLRAYEQGFVKEGVGAGGCAIAANLYQNWQQAQLLGAVEALLEQLLRLSSP